MAKLQDRRRFDEETLARLRGRAQHVIVVMFENRSFDQLFGLLDHPDRDNFEDYFVKVGSCPNPNEWAPNTPPVTVTNAGDYVLALDPPHGHQSAIEQMHVVGDDPHMDGFVNAYARKLSGKEPAIQKRWWLIGPVVVLLLAACGFAVADIVRRGDDPGRWPVFVGGVVIAVFALGYSLWTFPALSRWKLFVGVALAGIIVAAFVDGWIHWRDVFDRWLLIIIGAVGTLLVVAAGLWRWKMGQPEQPAPMTDVAAGVVAPTIMACLPPAKIPVLGFLARNYVTCVQWHSSVPGATWPNRNFAHAATSDESTDIEVGFYRDRTIFELLDRERSKELGGDDKKRTPWRIFFHDTPQVIAFRRLWRRDRWRRWHSAEGLLGAIDSGLLPTYSFVEPCHNAANGSLTNSQHPGNNQYSGDDFVRGEQLIRQIYTRLTLNPGLFEKTVLIITYDEHGGIHDHRKPLKAVPPESGLARFRARRFTRRFITWLLNYGNGFAFDRLGMRVPTVIVSPWAPRGHIDDTVYDHASIVASLRRLWAPKQRPLSDRDKAAYDIWDLLADRNARASVVDPPPDWMEPAAFQAQIGRELVAPDSPPVKPPPGSRDELDEFGLQLAKLDRVLDRRLPPPPVEGNDVSDRHPKSGIVKLRAWGDSTRNGNPSPEDF